MKTNEPSPQGRRPQRGGRRRSHQDKTPRDRRTNRSHEEKKMSFWQKLIAFFTGQKSRNSPSKKNTRSSQSAGGRQKSAQVEITSPRLFVGNLSYDSSESDLLELFNGAGQVQNAEIVTDRATYRSKGFGFVTMLTMDEAKRAAEMLHDKSFMGRNLVVTGSKPQERRS